MARRAAATRRRRSKRPLCREPWQSYYILRRGVLPCCYGYKPIAPMSEWPTAWNSAALHEIRTYLAKGALSPYCRDSLGCPIVQRYLAAHPKQEDVPTRPWILRAINRALFRLPARIYRTLGSRG